MKGVEKLAVVAVVLHLVAAVSGRMSWFLKANLHADGWSSTGIMLSSGFLAAVALSVQVAIAMWLYRVAGREGRPRWIWAMFGLVFGVPGAILFFAVRIHETLSGQSIGEHFD